MGFNWATAVIAPANSLHAIGGASCAGAVDYVTSSANVTMSIAGPLTTLISVPICGDTTPESHETFQVNLTGVSGATLTDGIGVGTINNDDALPTGALKISEFRATGPLGALTDGFVEIANTTGSARTIGALDHSPGFSVWTSGATKLFRIDNGVTIPAYGHYLAAGAGYSLSAFGGGAPGDTPFLTSLAPSTGIALYDHDANTLSPLDSVDFVGGPLVEGTGLASIGIPTGPHNFSFARRFPYGGGTVVLDNNDNVNDFALVAVDAGTYVTTLAVLGGPSPEGLTSEPERDAATEITLGLLDTAVGSLTAPNYQFVAGGPNAKYIELRRKATSAVTYANFRFKVTSLSTVHDDAGGTKADFRVTTSPTLVFGAGTANALTLEDFAAGGYLLSVPPALAFPALTAQGGLNSTLRAPALAAGVPLGVNFRMFYSTAGLPGFFWVTAEAKP